MPDARITYLYVVPLGFEIGRKVTDYFLFKTFFFRVQNFIIIIVFWMVLYGTKLTVKYYTYKCRVTYQLALNIIV